MCKTYDFFDESIRRDLESLSEGMNKTRRQIEDLQLELGGSRKRYKEKVEKYFQSAPPFPTGGKEVQQDIAQYLLLTALCLDAGDTDILKKWGIDLVCENPCALLASSEFQKYCQACEKALNKSKTPLEEDCWKLLITMFSSLMKETSQQSPQTQSSKSQ